MAILHSCCFWKSLRRGAYASVTYTLIYYVGIFLMEASYLYIERDYLAGNVDKPMGESFLEREKISSLSVIFSILLLFCSACGVIACILVFYGLAMDLRQFLVPWIIVMISHILFEVLHFIYLLILRSLYFDPLTAVLYTIDFFLMCLNVYCLLCVVSQYQEYKAGRGCDRREQNSLELQTESLRYIPPQPTMHHNHHQHHHKHHQDGKQLPQNRPLANSIYCTNCSSNKKSIAVLNRSPVNRRRSSSNVLKKHVQFPEDFKCVEEEILCCNDSNGNGSDTIAIDTPPSVIVSLQY